MFTSQWERPRDDKHSDPLPGSLAARSRSQQCGAARGPFKLLVGSESVRVRQISQFQSFTVTGRAQIARVRGACNLQKPFLSPAQIL